MKAFINAMLYPVSQDPIPNGVMLVDGDKIVSVGPQGSFDIPSDAEVIDLQGKSITPGFIDPHTHIGVFSEGIGVVGHDGNEMSDPITPYLRAIDGIFMEDVAFQDALKGGVTTVGITPGSANLIGGEIAALKVVGLTVEDKLIAAPVGMKMALGENPKRVYNEQKRSPRTRMANAYLIRKAFREAMYYTEQWAMYEKGGDEGKLPPKPDIGLENLSKLLARQIKARIHAHRADDIMTAIRICKEFDLDFSIEHCTEGHKIAEILALEKVPCVVGPILSNRSKVELRDRTVETPGILVKAGVKVCLTTDHPVTPIQYLRMSMMVAIQNGLPRNKALELITLNPAKLLGLEGRIGSLEPGKDADFVIFDGDPLQFESNIVSVYVDGKEHFKN